MMLFKSALMAASVAMLVACPSPSTNPGEPDAAVVRTDAGPSADAAPSVDAAPNADAAPSADAGPTADAAPIVDAEPGADASGTDATPAPDAAGGTDAGPTALLRVANFAVGRPTESADLCLERAGAAFPLYASVGRVTGIPTVSVGEYVEVPVGRYGVTLVRATGDCTQPLGPRRADFLLDALAYTEIVTLGTQDTSVLFTGAKPMSQPDRDQLIYADALAGVSGPVVGHALVLWVGGIPQVGANPAIQVGLRVGSMAYLQVAGLPPQRADRPYVAEPDGITSLFLYGDGTRTTTAARYLVCDDKAPAVDHLEVCSETLRR